MWTGVFIRSDNCICITVTALISANKFHFMLINHKCFFFLVCVFHSDGGVYSHDHREEKKQIPHR